LAHAFVKKRPDLLKDRALRAFVDISYALDNGDAVATVATADKLGHRIYNVSSNIHVTARETLEALYRVAPESEPELKLSVEEQATTRSDDYLDITRIRGDLGWRPKFTIDMMLADYVAWLRSNSH
jgi:UDP-glucose 4-epimerase